MFDHYHIDNHDLLKRILREVERMTINTAVLSANQARLVADVEALLTAFGKAQIDLATAVAALAAANAANDPAAIAAAQADIDAIAAALADEAAKVEAATAPPVTEPPVV